MKRIYDSAIKHMQNHLWDRRYVYSDQQIHDRDRTTREVKILTVMNTCVVNTCEVSLYYIVYREHPEMVNKPWSIVLKSRDGEQALKYRIKIQRWWTSPEVSY
jgi:hypothetical protein